MSRSLLDSWLDHYDPVHHGCTPAGIANGVCATLGFGFPRVRGGYNLWREVGGASGAAASIVGAAGAYATTIRTFPWVPHGPEAAYVYRLAAISGGGVENPAEAARAAALFDGEGAWFGPLPNAPGDLRVTPVAGGRFLIRWTHSSADEQDAPAAFHLYHDAGAGTIDFSQPAASVAYVPGRFHFAHVSAPFAHDERVGWVVRSVTAAGVEERNLRAVSALARATAPPGPPAVIVAPGASHG